MQRILSIFLLVASSYARDFTFVNNLGYTIWVGLQPNADQAVIAGGGWQMDDGTTVVQSIPDGWGGRFWARTGCSFDDSGNGACVTGDCGNVLQCNGAGGQPPITLVEIRLNGDNNNDFYDVSLVNGFNVGARITPTDQTGDGYSCTTAECTANVLANCPADLQETDSSGNVVGCNSSCDITQSVEDCCTNDQNVCAGSESASYFESVCPAAYSYAFDDATSTFTCQNTNYQVQFINT